MEAVFMKLVEMSVSASWLALAVILLRLILKKSPRWIHVCLWALVAVRLVSPISPESTFSLIPSDLTEQITEAVPDSYWGDSMIYSQGSESYNTAIGSGIPPVEGDNGYKYVVTRRDDASKPARTDRLLLGYVWIIGMAAMLIYAVVSYRKLRKKVAASLKLSHGVFLCDYIDTPFILDIISPKIYLPSVMDPNVAAHVLAHERAHIRRKDHWWKPLGFLLLTIHWFNPIMWVAYVLLCRDIELACDEKVIRDMKPSDKKSYSEALLSCSVPRHMIAACPLAFGEVGVKERVKTVLNYRKPSFWILVTAVLVLIVTAVCFLTDPARELPDPFQKDYKVEAVLYDSEKLDFQMAFRLTSEQKLEILENTDSDIWLTAGTFAHFKLTRDNFDRYFWDNFDGASLRRGNKNAWQLYVTDPEETTSWTRFYYLLQQRNGELYLVAGQFDPEGLQDRASDDSYMTQVYRLSAQLMGDELGTKYTESKVDPYAPADTPYQWTRNVTAEDVIISSVALHEEETYTYTPNAAQITALIQALNQVTQSDVQVVNYQNVKWEHLGVQVMLYNEEFVHSHLYLTNYGVMVEMGEGETLYPQLSAEENWFICNDALEQAMQELAYGGTNMLSDQNRQAVKNLLDPHFVQFFDPQVYGDLLFVGCIYGDDKTGLAVFQADGKGGYTLLRVTEYEYLNVCPETSNVWLDRYIDDWRNLYVFVNRNDILRQIQWTGEFETTVSAANDPRLVVVDVPEDAKSSYRFVYGKAGMTEYADASAGKPFVLSAEYAYQYANMKLSFFEGWEYQIQEYTDDYSGFGIRFRPEGEKGWIFLQFNPDGYGVCGTGLKTISGGMSNGYMTEHGYYDNNSIWSFIRITDMPGSYTIVNEGADDWIGEYETELNTILENVVVAEGYLDVGHIQGMALFYAQEQLWHNAADSSEGIIYESRFNYETGIWHVTLRKAGSAPLEVKINANGVVQTEE